VKSSDPQGPFWPADTSSSVCWSLPERPVSENLVIVKEYISPLHSIFLQSRDRMNRHPGSRESCASTNLGFVNFDVYAFRLTQGNVCSSIGKDYGLLHDQESQLFLEAYGVSQPAVMPVSCRAASNRLVACCGRRGLSEQRIQGVSTTDGLLHGSAISTRDISCLQRLQLP